MIAAATQILSVLTFIAQIIAVFLLVGILARRFKNAEVPYLNYFGKHAILFAFIVALAAMSGSLFYSEVAGYEPCLLCWYQRILMYPLVFLLGLALWRKETVIAPYAFLLSGIGAIIAGYHYLLQIGAVPELPCAAVGYSASCAQRFVMTFGYITIPMMAFSAFMLIALVLIASLARRDSQTG